MSNSEMLYYLRFINCARGNKLTKALLRNALDMIVEIGIGHMNFYEIDFETTMLKTTADYYSRKASIWILKDSTPDYMVKAEECLTLEKDSVSRCLPLSSKPKLVERVQHELIYVYASQLTEKEHSGCHALLRDDKVEDLSRMYRLFSNIPNGLDPVLNIFKQHVTNEGTAMVNQAEVAASNMEVFIQNIFKLHDKYLTYVNDCFMNNTLFDKALKDAFVIFCNKSICGSSNAEILASFCHNILKKGGTMKLSDEDMENKLGKVVKLLAYSDDKDVFAKIYRKHLSRRLIRNNDTVNNEHERSMLTKLKQQFGSQLTLAMDGMFRDVTVTKEYQSSFKEYVANNINGNPGIDLTVKVLTRGHWPRFKSVDVNLPAEMVECFEVYKEFYETKNKGRKLEIIHSEGSCTILGKFEPKAMELVVTPLQAYVLVLFNSSKKLSYQDIKSQSNLSDADAVCVLHSLSCAKYEILTKEPNIKTISPTDYFEFNSKFTDKMRRIKVPLLQVNDPLSVVNDKKEVIDDVGRDRRYAIEGSIVRIMKTYKILDYQQLVFHCSEQVKMQFNPDPKAIKERIEDLITREYLERDKDNGNLFRYLA